MERFAITVENGVALIVTPYNPEFVRKIKNAGGRWNAEKKAWAVPESLANEARYLMRNVYGRDDRPVTDAVDVVLTFNRNIYATCAPVVMFGRVLASAHGRDTGARPGENVIYLEGAPESGGSAKHWESIVPEGSVIKLPGVSRRVYEDNCYDGVTAEIAQPADKAAALKRLETEKAELLKRITEIEAEIAKLA